MKPYSSVNRYIKYSIGVLALTQITVPHVTGGPRGRDMSKKPESNSDSTGEWRARTGTHYELDTTLIRMLDGLQSVEEASSEAVPGTDPYNHTTMEPQSKRRSLDDMRELSEAIKKSRSQGQ